MINLKRYLILCSLSIVLFTFGIYLLEALESVKVSPFNHVEIKYYKKIYIASLISLFVYVPLTIISDYTPRNSFFLVLKIFIFSIIGIFIGRYIFFITFPEWIEVDGYNINPQTSTCIFGAVAFLYSIITNTKKNHKNV